MSAQSESENSIEQKFPRAWHIRSVFERGSSHGEKAGLSYAALRKDCLNAVRNWPGCETIGGIQIAQQKRNSVSRFE
jgi:hypothetical protein